MNRIRETIALALVCALLGLTTVAQTQTRDWQRSDRYDNRQAGQLVARIDQRAARFQTTVERAVRQSRMDNTRREDKITQFVTDFRESITQLRASVNRNQASNADVQMVLDRAARIDAFLQAHQGLTGVDSDWQMLRTDLDSLAGAYNIAWSWSDYDQRYGEQWGREGGWYNRDNNVNGRGGNWNRGNSAAARLSGTFQLNASQSDDARSIVERAVRTLPNNDRQRVSDALMRRVDAPEMLSIDRQGRTVMLASSRVPQLTFEADGQEHTETYPNSNRTSRVVATLTGDQLTINSTGDRATDFSVTFDPINNGRQLRVTRRLYSERLNQPIVVQSTYDQVSPTARWDITTGSPAYGGNRYPNDRGGNYDSNDYMVADSALIVARLNDSLDTTRTRAGDRFSLTVVSPPEYRDATIEGHIIDTNRSGRVTGRAELAMAFDSIRMQNGRTARFDGTLDSVRTANGETLRVDTEGTVRDDSSQTNKTVTRAAIGTAVGALIGAIAGGGKGAAVGAVVGGGAGAGSVFVQGRNDLQLTPGTEITIRASAPNRRAM
ncbi:MAG: YMGG-like glycine zipper-containing protein [Blastocatellia bacterium]